MSLPAHHNGSYWFDSLETLPEPQAPESLPSEIDVAIVGGGFTGLWTAYYLNALSPELGIGVFESETIGFGASGRNGGWCMGIAMGIDELLRSGRQEEGRALLRAMQATVDEVGRVAALEQIDCHFAKGGTLSVATTSAQAEQLKNRVEHMHGHGFGVTDFAWLDAAAARQRIGVQPNYGAAYTTHCAAIHPARLVRGLAEVLSDRGVTLFEKTRVRRLVPGVVETEHGDCRSPVIVRALEGYTRTIAGQTRTMLPLYSMLVATEPLSTSIWQEIGLHRRETFDDGRRITIYGQRTADGRLAFGGRVGYRFASRIRARVAPQDAAFKHIEATLKSLLPALGSVDITHRWGGVLGAPRHGRPFVTLDRTTGLGAAGGYTGEGVAATNLAGRILADLILERDTPRVKLPWVNDQPSAWPVEPLRYLGARTAFACGNIADAKELRRNRKSKFFGPLFDRFY